MSVTWWIFVMLHYVTLEQILIGLVVCLLLYPGALRERAAEMVHESGDINSMRPTFISVEPRGRGARQSGWQTGRKRS